MLNFKDIELSDREALSSILMKNRYRNCEFSFAVSYLWRKVYKTKFAVSGGMAVFMSDGTRFTMPVGDGELRPVIEEMMDYAAQRGIPFILRGVTHEARDELFSLFPDKFDYKENRDYCDYIYNRDDLVNLGGKKYHAKRNHINKYRALYGDVCYEKIDDANVEECMAMHRKWCEENDCIKDESLWQESCVVREAFRCRKELGLSGGALRIPGRGIVAFSMGSPINGDTFDVCIEKAFYDVEGAYTVINQQFALNECEGYQYMNREEDLGVEGLRKAKTSYLPAILLDKGTITLKNRSE